MGLQCSDLCQLNLYHREGTGGIALWSTGRPSAPRHIGKVLENISEDVAPLAEGEVCKRFFEEYVCSCLCMYEHGFDVSLFRNLV